MINGVNFSDSYANKRSQIIMNILKNGTLVTPQGLMNADLAFDNDKIVQIGPDIPVQQDDTVWDAAGCIVFPGFIDGHTHLDLNNGVMDTADNFKTGTRAAVCGGTTTIIDFATQDKGDTLIHALEHWKHLATGSSSNYAFHMAITDWNERTRSEIPTMQKEGVTSFKAYFAYDSLMVSDYQLLDILETLKSIDGIIGVHCENGPVINELQKRELAAGHTGPEAHPASRPAEVEAEAISRLCWLGKLANAPVHVVHLSSKLGLEVVREARKRGQTVYAETCPQYLLFDDSVYSLPDFEGAKYVMSPPLRKMDDIMALRQAVINGEINTISTDHCSFNFETQKKAGLHDFTKIPNGGPGVEHRPTTIMTTFQDSLSYEDFARLMSENQAKLFHLYPRKGALQVGSDADIAVWDPNCPWTISALNQHQNVDYTPYEGFHASGRMKYVFVNGVLASQNGEPTGLAAGRFVPTKTGI